jgi:hypothetical protein
LRQLIATRRGANDVRFHHDIGRPANHQEMLDVVAPDQDQTATAVDGGGIDHCQARQPSAIRAGADTVVGESANQPDGNATQGHEGHKQEDQGYCLHARSPANGTLRT